MLGLLSPSLSMLSIITPTNMAKMLTPNRSKGQHFFNGNEKNLESYKDLMKNSAKSPSTLGNLYIYLHIYVYMSIYLY
jgi:ribosome biogenesis protein Tsr3